MNFAKFLRTRIFKDTSDDCSYHVFEMNSMFLKTEPVKEYIFSKIVDYNTNFTENEFC